GQTLSVLARKHPARPAECAVVNSLRAAVAHGDDVATLLGAVARLWVSGVNVDWVAFHCHVRRRRTALPTYPFERQRFWLKAPAARTRTAGRAEGTKLGVADWFSVPSWKRSLPLGGTDAGTGSADWLVFAGDDDVSEAV